MTAPYVMQPVRRCSVCRVEIPYDGRGRPREYCPTHAPASTTRRDVERFLAADDAVTRRERA